MLTTYAASYNGIQYYGRWIYDGTRRYTKTQYSKCVFTFLGSSVRVNFNTRSDGGKAKIYLDGVEQCTVDTLNTENLKQMLFEKENICGDKIHELEVVSEKVKERPEAVLEVWSFEAEEIVNYPQYMRDRKLKEYDDISKGIKETSNRIVGKK